MVSHASYRYNLSRTYRFGSIVDPKSATRLANLPCEFLSHPTAAGTFSPTADVATSVLPGTSGNLTVKILLFDADLPPVPERRAMTLRDVTFLEESPCGDGR